MPENPIPHLEVRSVRKAFRAVVAVDGIDLAVRRGECVALVGESGSGKTTLLRMFNQLVTPDAGEVLLDGRSLVDRDAIEVRRGFGYVPQQGGLLPHWTVARNVGLVPRLLGREDRDAIRRRLSQVGLDPEEFADRWPRTLSGGQRQRVALARALVHEPAALLLDEPFGALDALTRAEVQRTFRELVTSQAITALLVTHDLEEARRVADRIAVLREGRLVATGSFEELAGSAGEPYVGQLFERAGVR